MDNLSSVGMAQAYAELEILSQAICTILLEADKKGVVFVLNPLWGAKIFRG
jgi:hypothetical protein